MVRRRQLQINPKRRKRLVMKTSSFARKRLAVGALGCAALFMNRPFHREILACASPSRRRARLLCLFGCALITCMPGEAIDLLVYNNNNTGPGSLRQAINDNNALGGGNTIIFSNTVTGTITLTSGELVISTNATILGPGPQVLTVSGNNASRVFNITGGTAAISGLTIANGGVTNNSGGGIANTGTLNLTNCLFTGNLAWVSAY